MTLTANPKSRLRLTSPEVILPLLLTASMFINYIDRSNLSIAAPLLQKEMTLTLAQIGVLSSAFFWTYALFQLLGISGWLCDRFPVSAVLTISAVLWGASTIVTGLLSSFWAIYSMRLVLGAGESLAYPCYSRILASDVPQKMRGRANALLDAASKLGPALGLLLGGLLMVKFGWRIFFITLGVASLGWAALWRYFTRRHPERADSETNIKISIRQALRSRSSWGTFAGHFCGNYVWFFLLLWLPTYLVEDKGLSLRSMTSIGSVAYFVIAFGTLCAGWFSDWRIGRGQSPTVVRKSIVVGGMLGSSLIVLAGVIHSTSSSLCLLFVVCFAFGTYTSNHWAITQTIAGPALAGRWTGLQNGVGNFSGIAAAWVTGEIATRTGSFRGAFAVTAVMAVTAALMWGLVVGPVCELSFEEA